MLITWRLPDGGIATTSLSPKPIAQARAAIRSGHEALATMARVGVSARIESDRKALERAEQRVARLERELDAAQAAMSGPKSAVKLADAIRRAEIAKAALDQSRLDLAAAREATQKAATLRQAAEAAELDQKRKADKALEALQGDAPARAEARRLQEIGAIPKDWVAVSFGEAAPIENSAPSA